MSSLRMSLAFIVVGATATAAHAQTVHSSVPDLTLSKAADGWSYESNATLGGNFSRQEDVVGKETGNTVTVNGDASSLLKYIAGANELRLTIALQEAMSRTPSLPNNVLTIDRLKLGSMYLYNIPSITWLSPYASIDVETNVFNGYTYSSTPTDFQIIGEGTPDKTASKSFQLTESFGLSTLKESVGGIAKLWTATACSGELKLGLGAMQIFADDQFAVADDVATAGVIEVAPLANSRKVGLDSLLMIKGDLLEKTLTWSMYAGFFGPFSVHPKLADDTDAFTEAATTEYGAKFAYNPLTWLSLSYEFRNYREPLISDDHQITHNFLVSLTYKATGTL